MRRGNGTGPIRRGDDDDVASIDRAIVWTAAPTCLADRLAMRSHLRASLDARLRRR